MALGQRDIEEGSGGRRTHGCRAARRGDAPSRAARDARKNLTTAAWKKQSEEQDGILNPPCLLKGSLSLLLPLLPVGWAPPRTAPPMAGHADAPGGRAAAPREAAGSALEVVNQATWADQSGPSLDLMQLLPHWLPTLRSAWEPTAEPTTSQQLSARTKMPAKSLLIVPWPWSDRRRPEPERVFSERRPPAESLRHLCPCSSGIGDGFGAGAPRALGRSACPGKLARLSCSLSPFSNQEHTLSNKSHLAGESGRGGAVGKSHRTGATPRGLSPILPRRLARKELMLARPGVASQRGGWPARETSLQVGRVTSQPPLIPKKSQRNP